jgi:hypothetical protein
LVLKATEGDFQCIHQGCIASTIEAVSPVRPSLLGQTRVAEF